MVFTILQLDYIDQVDDFRHDFNLILSVKCQVAYCLSIAVGFTANIRGKSGQRVAEWQSEVLDSINSCIYLEQWGSFSHFLFLLLIDCV